MPIFCEDNMKRFFLLLLILLIPSITAMAQTIYSSLQKGKTVNRKSVTGTYKYVQNTLSVVELPEQKVSLDFIGFWPNIKRSQMRKYDVDTFNTGVFKETVPLKKGVAIVKLEFGENPCVITVRFSRNRLEVTQEGTSNDCGFGFNVEADGVYVKTSARPE